MVPLSEALETGAWLAVECPYDRYGPSSEYDDINGGKPWIFRIRVTGFSKIDLSTVEGPEQLKLPLDANIWKLDLDFVNLCLRESSSSYLCRRLVLKDCDGYEFVRCDDSYLSYYSDFAKKSRLSEFYNEKLPPKIRRTGALAFELPQEFDSLNLAVRQGSVCEA